MPAMAPLGKVDELLPRDGKVGLDPEDEPDELPVSVVADVASNVTESIQSIYEGKSMPTLGKL